MPKYGHVTVFLWHQWAVTLKLFDIPRLYSFPMLGLANLCTTAQKSRFARVTSSLLSSVTKGKAGALFAIWLHSFPFFCRFVGFFLLWLVYQPAVRMVAWDGEYPEARREWCTSVNKQQQPQIDHNNDQEGTMERIARKGYLRYAKMISKTNLRERRSHGHFRAQKDYSLTYSWSFPFLFFIWFMFSNYFLILFAFGGGFGFGCGFGFGFASIFIPSTLGYLV